MAIWPAARLGSLNGIHGYVGMSPENWTPKEIQRVRGGIACSAAQDVAQSLVNDYKVTQLKEAQRAAVWNRRLRFSGDHETIQVNPSDQECSRYPSLDHFNSFKELNI